MSFWRFRVKVLNRCGFEALIMHGLRIQCFAAEKLGLVRAQRSPTHDLVFSENRGP